MIACIGVLGFSFQSIYVCEGKGWLNELKYIVHSVLKLHICNITKQILKQLIQEFNIFAVDVMCMIICDVIKQNESELAKY